MISPKTSLSCFHDGLLSGLPTIALILVGCLFLVAGCMKEPDAEVPDKASADPSTTKPNGYIELQDSELADQSNGPESTTDEESSLSDTAVLGPVVARIKIDPDKSDANELEIVLTLDCEFGWHTYARVGAEGGFQLTTVEFQNRDELTVIRDWSKPRGTPYRQQPGTLIYRGLSEFRCRVQMPNEPKRLIAKVSLQACDDSTCLPPASASLALNLENDSRP